MFVITSSDSSFRARARERSLSIDLLLASIVSHAFTDPRAASNVAAFFQICVYTSDVTSSASASFRSTRRAIP
jgi:hypothetical protein